MGQHPSTSSASNRPAVRSRWFKTSAPATASHGTPCSRVRYDIKVIVKDSYQRHNRRVHERVLYGEVAGRGNRRAVISPMSNPLVALYSAPPSAGSSMYVQFSPAGPQPVLARYRPAAHCAGGEHQLHRSWHAAQHDVPHEGRPERWDGLRPSAVHDREPADELDFPHLH